MGQNGSRLHHPLFPDIVNMYQDFLGRELVTAAVNRKPFFEVNVLNNGTTVSGRGIDVSIINALSNYLNFT